MGEIVLTTLLIIRHGESTANGNGFFAGHTDISLSERGKEQAENTAKYIVENYAVDKIYSSDLIRAYYTALPLSEKLNIAIIPDKNLREIFAGEWQGKAFDELERDYSESYRIWLNDIGYAKPDGGESTKELSEHVFNCIEKIAKDNDGKTVVVVTHATPIRSLLCKLVNGSLSEMKNVSWVSNSSLTKIEYQNGTYKVVEIGTDFYLDELKTVFPANV